MAFDTNTERNIALKKLLGKAHTSNDKGVANESLPSNITLGSNTVFGEVIPTESIGGGLWSITSNIVEKVQLSASFIPGTDTATGRHGFQLRLPSTYEDLSSNPSAGTGKFVNGGIIQSSNGGLQLVPTSFSNTYEAEIYHSASGVGVLTQIPVADARDWNLDYFNGILFQETPPGTGQQDTNPSIVNAYLYIGDYLNEKVDVALSRAALNANVENRLVTVAAATSNLDGEPNLTFDGSLLTANCGIVHKRVSKNAHHTIVTNDYFVGVSPTASLKLTLPSANTCTSGQTWVIKDESGNAGTYDVEVSCSGGDLIDGQGSVSLISPYAAVNIYTDGASKFFVY